MTLWFGQSAWLLLAILLLTAVAAIAKTDNGNRAALHRKRSPASADAGQVADNIEPIVQFRHDVVSSNLPLCGYTSDSVRFGPQIRF